MAKNKEDILEVLRDAEIALDSAASDLRSAEMNVARLRRSVESDEVSADTTPFDVMLDKQRLGYSVEESVRLAAKACGYNLPVGWPAGGGY